MNIEIYVIDPDTLDRIGIIDERTSFQWYPSYSRVGSFELYCGMEYFALLQVDRFIQNSNDNNHFGVIEIIEKVQDETGFESLKIKGRMGESLLNKIVALGEWAYDSQQPSFIMADLIDKNAINPTDILRKKHKFQVGHLEPAVGGVISFSGINTDLYDTIEQIASQSLLGFNMRLDFESKKIIFDTYKGINRTQEANTETRIETVEVTNMIQNDHFTQGFAGWNIVNNDRGFNFRTQQEFGAYPMTVSGGILSKSKVYDIEYGEEEEIVWNVSPHAYQNVTLLKDHLYFVIVNVHNPTDSIVTFGLNNINVEKTLAYTRFTAAAVVEKDGVYPFYMGIGDLSEVGNQFVLMDYGALIDLTATFGVGKEPTLEYATNNIYYDNGWKYKQQILSLVPNLNEPLVLSRDRDNLIEVSYTKNTVNEATFMYIQGEGLVTSITTGNQTDLHRKEVSIDLSSEVPRSYGGVLIPEQSYISMLQYRGWATLRKLVVSEIIEANLYLLSNKMFGRDFYLGDIVDCTDSSIGFSVYLRISEVSESWDINGYSISLSLGENIPDIYDSIKLVMKGAK